MWDEIEKIVNEYNKSQEPISEILFRDGIFKYYIDEDKGDSCIFLFTNQTLIFIKMLDPEKVIIEVVVGVNNVGQHTHRTICFNYCVFIVKDQIDNREYDRIEIQYHNQNNFLKENSRFITIQTARGDKAQFIHEDEKWKRVWLPI